MDWPIDDDWKDENPAAQTREERELVPEGEHEFRIRQVIPSGERLEIRLEHEDRRYGWVFCKLPKGQQWAGRIVASLARACGMSAEEWKAADPGDLAGRLVRAEIYHKAGKTGGTFVNVSRFAPQGPATVERAVAPPAQRAPVRRTAAQKIETPSDDIPF